MELNPYSEPVVQENYCICANPQPKFKRWLSREASSTGAIGGFLNKQHAPPPAACTFLLARRVTVRQKST
jgi:hypothetical protein